MEKIDADMIFQILTWISTSCFHQIHYFRKNQLLFSTYDIPKSTAFARENPFRCDSELFTALNQSHNASANKEITPPPYILNEATNQNIYYGILNLPLGDIFIIGPLAVEKLTPLHLREYMRHHHMKDFRNYFIPTGSIAQLTALLSLLSFVLTGNSQTPVIHLAENADIPDARTENAVKISSDMALQGYQLDNAELGIQHIPYKVESHIMSCIRDGKLDLLMKLHDESQGFSSGEMSKSALKQIEYTSVVSVSLMARAAIEGGVNPYHAYDMNDLYLQRISSAKTEDCYQQIQMEASRDFISAVKKSQALKSQSVHCENCKQYIARHLNSPFALDDISSSVGLNRTYLSGLFRQYESMTLKEYTHRERINAAKNMLRYSDYEISQIAEYFCFQSQSHFGKIFKKYAGVTPLQYRRQTGHW